MSKVKPIKTKLNLSPEEFAQIARDEKNAYQRNWRENHKDKIREYTRRYWARRALERAGS